MINVSRHTTKFQLTSASGRRALCKIHTYFLLPRQRNGLARGESIEHLQVPCHRPATLPSPIGGCMSGILPVEVPAMRFLSAICLSALLFSSPARAQPKPEPTPEPKSDCKEYQSSGEYRILGGHRFVTPLLIDSAFANTSVAFTQGGGVFAYRGPSALDGQQRDAQVFLYSQGFLVTAGIANRVALDFRAAGAAAVGGDLDTILSVGAIANLNAGGMAKLRVVTLEDIGFQATVGFGAYYNKTLSLQPAILIGKALGDAKSQEAQIVQSANSLELAPAVMIAEGLGAVGIQASASPRIRTADGQTSVVDAGAMLTFDFGKFSYVPIALSGEYQVSIPTSGAAVDNNMGASVFYSGRRDFNIGLLAAMYLYGNSSKIVMGGMAMQYFF